MFLYLFKHELRLYFPRWFSPFIQVGVIALSLVFYWYFSKAVVATPGLLSEMPEGYFIYLIVGEISLLWPGVLLANSSQMIKQFYYKRSLDNLIVLRSQAVNLLVKISFAQVLVQSLKYVLYFAALLFFSREVTFLGLLNFLILQLIYVPIFLSLGLLAASIVVFYGRGEKIIQLFVSASYVMAGVYFPAKVFPKVVEGLFAYSPFNDLIKYSRLILSGNLTVTEIPIKLGVYLLIGVMLFLVSSKLFCYLIIKCDRPINHRPLIS